MHVFVQLQGGKIRRVANRKGGYHFSTSDRYDRKTHVEAVLRAQKLVERALLRLQQAELALGCERKKAYAVKSPSKRAIRRQRQRQAVLLFNHGHAPFHEIAGLEHIDSTWTFTAGGGACEIDIQYRNGKIVWASAGPALEECCGF
jgi:hypothetical protein